MRVAVGGFQNETNTFSPVLGTWEVFAQPDGWPGVTVGPALPDAVRGMNMALAGLFEGAGTVGWDAVPLAWCGGGASGMVTEDAFERCSALILDTLAAAMPVDAVLMDLHGALTAAHAPDGDGAFLRRLRDLVGPEVPVFCSLDLHGNLTREMVDLADFMLCCRTYPHLDMAETGRRTTAALAAHLQDRAVPIHKAFRQVPFLIGLHKGCTMTEPAASAYGELARLEAATDGVTSLSFACGFAPADVAHCGPSILGYGPDADAVEAAAEALYRYVLAREPAFRSDLPMPGEAVARALRLLPGAAGRGPVILADVEDNAGGGEASCATFILRELIRQGARGAVVGVLCDPAAAEAVHAAGVGAEVGIGVGGWSGRAGDQPVDGPWRVLALSDGVFDATGVYFEGCRMDLGPMAVLETGGVRVLVSTGREQAADRAMFTHLGIDPGAVPILSLKSTAHFRADFQAIGAEIIETGAPDRPTGDRPTYAYRNLREGVRVVPGGPGFVPEAGV